MMYKLLLISLAGLLISNVAIAADPAAGKSKSQACQACHGQDGNSPTPNFPNLAGQYEDYLLQTLKDYKSGARKNAIMAGMVAPLSEQDMKDLAAYYSSQKGLETVKID
ncbi:MAG: cytochrome c [Pseudomonadota bacterium]